MRYVFVLALLCLACETPKEPSNKVQPDLDPTPGPSLLEPQPIESPTPSPTPDPTATPSPSPTPDPTATPLPTPTPTPDPRMNFLEGVWQNVDTPADEFTFGPFS